jgi:hypothetical protein
MDADVNILGLPSRLWLFIVVMCITVRIYYYAIVTFPKRMKQHRTYAPMAERLNQSFRASMVFNMNEFDVVMQVLDKSGIMASTVKLIIKADDDRVGPYRLAAILNSNGADKHYQWFGFKKGVVLKAVSGWELVFHFPSKCPEVLQDVS